MCRVARRSWVPRGALCTAWRAAPVGWASRVPLAGRGAPRVGGPRAHVRRGAPPARGARAGGACVGRHARRHGAHVHGRPARAAPRADVPDGHRARRRPPGADVGTGGAAVAAARGARHGCTSEGRGARPAICARRRGAWHSGHMARAARSSGSGRLRSRPHVPHGPSGIRTAQNRRAASRAIRRASSAPRRFPLRAQSSTARAESARHSRSAARRSAGVTVAHPIRGGP